MINNPAPRITPNMADLRKAISVAFRGVKVLSKQENGWSIKVEIETSYFTFSLKPGACGTGRHLRWWRKAKRDDDRPFGEAVLNNLWKIAEQRVDKC